MEQETLAMVGFGDLAARLAARLRPRRWRCLGLRRRAQEMPKGVQGIAVDLARPASLKVLGERRPDALMIALSPAERTVEGYRRGFSEAMGSILAGLGGHQPRLAMFVSSTRVYAEEAGGWVDEDSPLNADDPYAGAIIDAETALLEALPGARILRAAGLYGLDAGSGAGSTGPGPLVRRVAAGRLSPETPLCYGNRVHRDDVAGFMAQLLEDAAGPRIINLVDDAPVALQEVEEWLCAQLGRSCERPAADPGAAPRHKRIRNDRLHASGYSLVYPDYRAGYRAVLDRWVRHSEREDGLDLH